MKAVHHRGEAHEHRGSLPRGEYLGLGQCGNIGAGGELAMGTGTAGMHHTLRHPLAIKTLQLLDQLHVLQQGGAGTASGLRVLVVAHRGAIVAS